MTDLTITGLVEEVSRRKSESERLRVEARRLNGRASQLDQDVEHLEGSIKILMQRPFDPQNGKPPAAPGPIREAAYKLLKERGIPLTKSAISEELRGLEIFVGGAAPMQNLSAHLSNDPRIEPVGDGMWGLVEWRTTAGSATPQKQSEPTSYRRRLPAAFDASTQNVPVHGMSALDRLQQERGGEIGGKERG